jgi:transposase
MGRPLTQATIDRLRRLCDVHTMTAAAEIVGVNRRSITDAKARGWKAAYQDHRQRPSDFTLLCDTMTIDELRKHYRASDHTVRRWADEVGRKRSKRGGNKRRAIPADLAQIVADLGPYGAATHYGVSYGTVKIWRKKCGLPVSWSRRPKVNAAPTQIGWADRYFQQQREAR